MRVFLPLLAALLLTWTPAASAAEPTVAEREGLERRIELQDRALAQGEAETLVGLVPPSMLRAVAAQKNVKPAVVRASLVNALKEKYRDGPPAEVHFHADTAHIEFRQFDDGRPYALIPAVDQGEADGRTFEVSYPLLALLEDGEWYFHHLNSPGQVAAVVRLYPGIDLKGFPEPKLREITE